MRSLSTTTESAPTKATGTWEATVFEVKGLKHEEASKGYGA